MYLTFLLQVKNSIMLGCQYSIIAIGFTLFFGMLNVVVFCHGDFYILATFAATALIAAITGIFPPLINSVLIIFALLMAMVITGFVGIIVERTTIRPFRKAPPVMPILSTIAVGIIIEQLIRLFYPAGSNPQVFPSIFKPGGVNIGPFLISMNEVTILIITAVIFILMFLLFKTTRIGLQIVAISQDFEAASMVGINVDRAVSVTFFLGASLAAIAGFMNGIYYTVFRYDMGAIAGIKGFSASVVGGLGSVFGAVIGGFIMAFVETFAAAYVPNGSAFRDVFSFSVVLLFLIFRPSGILGEKIIEKV